jgi:hypothetical protein
MASRVHVPALGVVTLAISTLASGQPPVRSQPAQTNPPRDVQAAQTGTAGISGRILAADTGRPLRRAQIRLSATELGREPRTTSTDADGRYEFTDLPAGRYTVSVGRSGYLTLQYGQRRPLEQGKPLQLADRQTVQDVDFALPRMSLIIGRVTDELGEPIAGVNVSAMRSAYWDGRRRLVPAGPVSRSDEAGEYRIVGLVPGAYVVVAKTADKWTVGDSGQETTMAYAPTFFPGTTHVSDATKITVGIGKQAENIEFALVPGRAATISGTATNSQGRPLATVMLVQETLGPSGGMVGIAGNASVAGDGRFTMRNVTPGEYKLQAARDRESVVLPIVVEGVDIDNVALITSSGWSVTGKVLTDSGAVPSLPRDRVRIVSRSLAVNGMGMAEGNPESRPVIRDDWTFFVPGMPGPARLVVTLPDGWIVNAISHQGRDITDAPIDLKSGEELSGVQVMLTDRVATVTGQLTDDKGTPVADGTVIVFAADSTKWYDGSRFVRAVRPDQKGRYQIAGLLPGEYLAVAVDYVEQGLWNEAEYLESLRQHAQKVTLADGSRTITLKLVVMP